MKLLNLILEMFIRKSLKKINLIMLLKVDLQKAY